MSDVRTGCSAQSVETRSGRHACARARASLMLVSLTGRCAPGMRWMPLRRGTTREASHAWTRAGCWRGTHRRLSGRGFGSMSIGETGGDGGGDIRALGVTAFSGHVKRRSEGWDVRCRRVWQSRPDAGAKTRYETLARIRKQRKRAGRTGYSPTSGRPGPNAVS